MSRRIERVNEFIRQEIANIILTELNDPRIPLMTSVTAVDTSADLSVAVARISVMGDEKAAQFALRAFQESATFIRKLLSQRMHMRTVPFLKFVYDDSIKRSFDIQKLIADARGTDPAAAIDPAPEEAEE